MIALGIDPGRKGALALLDVHEHALTVHDMPGTTAELQSLLCTFPPVRLCVLEQLHAGPQMSRTTTARMFEAYGALRASLQWRDIPVTTVRPNKWKPALGLTGDKNLSRQKASELFPAQADLFARAKDDGRAEAALLAWYAVRKD